MKEKIYFSDGDNRDDENLPLSLQAVQKYIGRKKLLKIFIPILGSLDVRAREIADKFPYKIHITPSHHLHGDNWGIKYEL